MKKYKKFKEYDEEMFVMREDRGQHLKEKRIRSALRSRDFNQLLDMDDCT